MQNFTDGQHTDTLNWASDVLRAAGFIVARKAEWSKRNIPGGNYSCECAQCQRMFTGFKRSAVCQMCSDERPAMTQADVMAITHQSDSVTKVMDQIYPQWRNMSATDSVRLALDLALLHVEDHEKTMLKLKYLALQKQLQDSHTA